MSLRTCRSCWGTVMAPTGRSSERIVAGQPMKLTWYRCQICFALSDELERPRTEALSPDPQAEPAALEISN